MNRAITRLLATVGALAIAPLCLGHAVIDDWVKPANTFQFVSLRITHGCGEAATNKVIVKIPEGITRVSPAWKPGWNIIVAKRPLDEPYENEDGSKTTETADTVTWEGGPLPNGYYDVFQLRVLLPDNEGGIYRFFTVQECVNGEKIRWIQVPEEGESPWTLPEPAPYVELSAPVEQY